MNALAHLGALRAPHDPRLLAQRILRERRFAHPGHAQRTWWDALWEWLSARWHQFADAYFRRIHLGKGANVLLGDMLAVIAIGVIVIVLARLLFGMTREHTAAHHALTPDGSLQADELLARAHEAAQQDAYAAAVSLLFRAVLARFDEAGVLREDATRTVNECRRDVRMRAPQAQAAFDRLARIFTAAIYAEEPVGAAQWTQALHAYETLDVQAARAA